MSKKQAKKPKAKKKGSKKGKLLPKRIDLLNQQQSWIGFGILAVLTFLLLSPLISAAFLNYDDDIYITNNPYILNFNGSSIGALFSDYFANQYSPVAMIFMAIESKLVGMEASGLKVISILLHILNGFLVFRLIQVLFKRYDFALIVATLFCIHPMQLESVAWLSAAMKIETFSLFFLASLLAYTSYIDKGNKLNYYISAFILFVLACFSKEQAVSLAVTLFAIDYVRDRNLLNQRVLLEKVPFLVVAIIFGIITLSASQGIDQNQNVLLFSLADRLVFAAYSFVAYLGKIILPINLSFLYFFPKKGAIPITYYLSILALLPLAYALFYTIKNGYKKVAFGFLFFAINIGLAVVSQAFAVRDVIMADRYVYLPIIGCFIIVAYAVTALIKQRPRSKTAILAGLGLYCIVLAALTVQRTAIWKDSIAVFSDAIEKANDPTTPYLSLAYLNRGLGRKAAGDIKGAFEDYNQAITLNAVDHKAFLNRGNIYFNDGKWDQAIADYDKAEAIIKTNAKIYSSRGAAYASKKNYPQAIQDLTRALELEPNFSDALKNRTVVYSYAGQYDAAIADCNLYLNQFPNDGDMINQRGLLHQALNRIKEAEADFNRAIQVNPKKGDYYLSRSKFYNQIGNKAEALKDAQRAQQTGAQVDINYINSLR